MSEPSQEHVSLSSSISESSGFQNHVSTSSSFRRLRASSHSVGVSLTDSDAECETDPTRPVPSSPGSSNAILRLARDIIPVGFWSKWHPCLRWLAITYTAGGIVFFFANLLPQFSTYCSTSSNAFPLDASVLTELDPKYHLSRLTTIRPLPSFYPNAIAVDSQPGLNNGSITACMWITMEQVDDLGIWMRDWPGFASVVLVTNSSEYLTGDSSNTQVLRRLSPLANIISERLALHVLEIKSPTLNPNAYLNLARLFSPSQINLLIPHSFQPYNTLLHEQLRSDIFAKELEQAHVLLAERSLSPNSITSTMDIHTPEWSMLAAVIIHRDIAPWCPERFFSSPQSEWEECLWTLWLTSRGKVQISNYQVDAYGEGEARRQLAPTTPSAAEIRIHKRLNTKYRSELCLLRARGLLALGQWHEQGPHSESSWIRNACSEALALWGKDLLEQS